MEDNYFKGRGAQLNSANPFKKQQYVTEHQEGLDEPLLQSPQTQLFYEEPKSILSKINSPDLPMSYGLNPYQGCEHGCIYCYARNTHQYWGFSAGLEFESKIIVKRNAAQMLEKQLLSKAWQPVVISLSGNTDCYQPIEKKLRITREVLKVFAKFQNPVSIITKNSLIIRDLDILSDLAAANLVHVYISITTLDEKLRQKLEPRTATGLNRLKTIETLTKAGIPVGVMVAPVIPGLNDYEIPNIIKAAAEAGALTAGYTVVRLNGAVKELFHDWLHKNFPDRAQKVWGLIADIHGGEVSDSEWGRRISGDGKIAEMIKTLYQAAKKKHLQGRQMPPYDLSKFRRNLNLNLFD
jgi:DNA repair photolyase